MRNHPEMGEGFGMSLKKDFGRIGYSWRHDDSRGFCRRIFISCSRHNALRRYRAGRHGLGKIQVEYVGVARPVPPPPSRRRKRHEDLNCFAYLPDVAVSAGAANPCNYLNAPDDARAYIRYIDVAREAAIKTLIRGTHPDANPDPPYGGFSTATADGETYILPPARPYINATQTTNARLTSSPATGPICRRRRTWTQAFPTGNTVTLHRTLDDFERYIEFRRAADGGWEWTQFNDRNEEEMLETWEWISLVEHNDIKIAFPDANG